MIADVVRRGLGAVPKTLPPFLLYDEEGSRLYERITTLPEYYLTRTEYGILQAHAAEIVAAAARGAGAPLAVVELGAGTAAKTEILLRELVRRQKTGRYVPIDISGPTLLRTRQRLREVMPDIEVLPRVTTLHQAFDATWDLATPRLVLFIGSSVGNLDDEEGAALLASIGRALGPRTYLLLGTDLKKDPAELVRAYDDAAGVTAAFNKNVLARINRELGGNFSLEAFRHVARWNEGASRIEMHLESKVAQVVSVAALPMNVAFEAGETIHTESSVKYDLPRVERLLGGGGFALERTFFDPTQRFAVHLARYANEGSHGSS
jgi:dimethylhistidine N-methyltransferase